MYATKNPIFIKETLLLYMHYYNPTVPPQTLQVTRKNCYTLLNVGNVMLLSELLKFDEEPRERKSDSGPIQDERMPIFSPALRSKKDDLVDFIKLNNHGILVLFMP